MLNAKILAAVFMSLAAISFGMNGGSLDMNTLEQISSGEGGSPLSGIMPNSLGAFSKYLEKPVEPTTVKAVLEAEGLEGHSVEVTTKTLEISNLTSLSINGNRLESDHNIVFDRYQGLVTFQNGTVLQGTTSAIHTNGVSINGGITVGEKVKTDYMKLTAVNNSDIMLTSVSGTLTSKSSNAELEDARFSAESFDGDITYFLSNNTVVLDGKVESLKAGEIKLGN